MPEIVAPSSTSPTTTTATTTVAPARQHHHVPHHHVPQTTAQIPIKPQTGSEIDSVRVYHGEKWTGLEIFGATTGGLFCLYMGLNIGSALCLIVSAGLDVWCPGRHPKVSRVLTRLGCFFYYTGVKTLGLINLLTFGKFFEALGLDPADTQRHPLHDMPGRERLRAVGESEV